MSTLKPSSIAEPVIRCNECDRKIPRDPLPGRIESDTTCAECTQPFSLDEIKSMFGALNRLELNSARAGRAVMVDDLLEMTKRLAVEQSKAAIQEFQRNFNVILKDLQHEMERRVGKILGPLMLACEQWRSFHASPDHLRAEHDGILVATIDHLKPFLGDLAKMDEVAERIAEAGEGLDESGGQTIKLAPIGVAGTRKLYICTASGRISRSETCVWHPSAFSILIGYEL